MAWRDPIARLFGFVEASHVRALFVLAVATLALTLPGLWSLPPMDRDEPRFAQATKQMIETGDGIDIRFQGEARHKKPVGIYWLQAATIKAAEAVGLAQARTMIWLYRLPSQLGALLTVLFTYLAAAALMSRRAAFVAGLLMASTVLLGVEARLAKTDAVLAATVCVAMAALARTWWARFEPQPRVRLRDDQLPPANGQGAPASRVEAPQASSGPAACLAQWGWPVAFWVALGVGALVKGPIAPAIVGLAALVLAVAERDAGWLRRLRPGAGLLIFLAIVAPWLVAITLKSGGGFFAEAVGQDMLAKVASGQESHGAPPGTYLLAFFGTAWPMAPFALLALPFIWRERRDPVVLFALAWLVPMWLIFEAVPTKLPHYVLPLYPALALLVALAAERGSLAVEGWGARLVMVLLPALPVLLAGALLYGLVAVDGVWPVATTAFLLAAAGFGVAGMRLLLRERVGSAVVVAALAALSVAWGFYGFAVPLAKAASLSPRLMEAAAAAGCRAPKLATVGYREPSLVLLGGTDLVMTDGAGAAAFLAGEGCRVVFVEARAEPAFAAALIGTGRQARLVSRVKGINLNGGRKLDIGVYMRQDTGP